MSMWRGRIGRGGIFSRCYGPSKPTRLSLDIRAWLVAPRSEIIKEGKSHHAETLALSKIDIFSRPAGIAWRSS